MTRWISLFAVTATACSTTMFVLPDAGGVDASDSAIGFPLDASKDTTDESWDAAVDDVASDTIDAAVDAKLDSSVDVDAADWPSIVNTTCGGGLSCSWTSNAGYPAWYDCIECLDTTGCGSLYPWNNGCGDAGTVYDPVVSAYDGSSSILKFCAPAGCPPF